MEPTTILFVLIALVLGALIGWLIAGNKAAGARETLTAAKDQEILQLKTRIAELESTLTARDSALEQTRTALMDSFRSAASEALQNNNKQFLELASQKLDGTVKENAGELEQRKAAIEELLKPLKLSIDKHKERSEELERASQRTFGSLHEMLGSLQGSQDLLKKETGNLATALKNPRVRGRWGEIGLRRVVEFSGMSGHCDFTEQTHVRTEDDRSLRPDMIVKLPNERNIIVDSKLPLAAYLDAVEAPDEITREAHLKRYAESVRGHVNALSKKEYWAQFKDHADFVVLYIEVEPAFGTALELDRNLIEDGLKNKIIFATPTTLIAMLRAIELTWQQKDIAKNAEEIADAAAELHKRLNTYSDHLADIGKGLSSAVKCYNSAIGSWEVSVLPSGRRLEKLHGKLSATALKGAKIVETMVREVRGVEGEVKSSDQAEPPN
jgi:DNA recombination protein RmuC